MTKFFRVFAIALIAVAAAGSAKAADITVSDAWARASAGMAKAGGAFMTIVNNGGSDKLVSASADVSKVVELHTHIMDGQVMRMRQVPSIDVPGGTTTTLQPGGFHVMLIGLHDGLTEGDTFPMTLTFEKAGDVTVDVTVKAAGAMGMGNMNHGMKGMHGQGGMQGHGNMGGMKGQMNQ